MAAGVHTRPREHSVFRLLTGAVFAHPAYVLTPACAPFPTCSTLPKPVGDDFQCAVATSPHTLLAVGGVERAGLFTKQRGIWQYNAHEGSWTRAGYEWRAEL